jgi:hypothetical protein
MPDAKDRYEELGVAPVNGKLTVFHPLSAEQRDIEIELCERDVVAALRGIAGSQPSLKARFLSLWRLAPERLCARWQGLRLQPADTRCPDHTLWHHLDSTAAMAWALRGGVGPALLSFKIGPVQPFIEAARSLRDLLTGSYLLSTLMFAAIEPPARFMRTHGACLPRTARNPLNGSLALSTRHPDQSTQTRSSIPAVDSPSFSSARSPRAGGQTDETITRGGAGQVARDLR